MPGWVDPEGMLLQLTWVATAIVCVPPIIGRLASFYIFSMLNKCFSDAFIFLSGSVELHQASHGPEAGFSFPPSARLFSGSLEGRRRNTLF